MKPFVFPPAAWSLLISLIPITASAEARGDARDLLGGEIVQVPGDAGSDNQPEASSRSLSRPSLSEEPTRPRSVWSSNVVQDQSSPSALGTRHLNTKSLVSPLDVPNIREIVAKFVLATSIVLAMAMGLIWLCRMCLASKAHSARGGERIRLRATANLGSRCFAQLLEVDDRLVLVGRDATGIKSMLALDRPFGAELDGLTGDERFSAEVA